MPHLFSLEVLPAAEGDCLILHWGDDRTMALVDGGPAKVYERTLRPRLMEIRDAAGAGPLTLAFVMVSHVDNDHIIGITKLFAELRNAQTRDESIAERPLRVERLWYNAFTDALGEEFDAYCSPSAMAALATATAAAGDPTKLRAALKAAGIAGHPAEEDALDLAFVLAGHGEGRALRDDHAYLHEAKQTQRLNAPFATSHRSEAIVRRDPAATARLNGLEIRVIGPSEKELAELQSDFRRYLVEEGLAFPDALLAAARSKDSSLTNLSSIVCLLTFGGDRILLTGDARGDRILEGLAGAGLLKAGPLKVGALKVPHHGSARNVTPEFFRTIRADTYVLSANGKYGNPDRETIEWLIESRDPDDDYRIVFTYPIRQIDEIRRAIQERRRETWVPERDAIEELLTQRVQDGYKFEWSEGRSVVDLGDTAMRW